MSTAWTMTIDSGWGVDAQALRKALDRSDDNSFRRGPADRLEILWELWNETQQAGWNGYGARPVSPEALWWAKAFLDSLPATWEDPEISADPDGDVTFEWSAGPSSVFAVSIDRTGAAHYAGLFGRARKNGTEPSIDLVQGVVAESLARLFPQVLSRAS
jgi:hypothetical protein